MHEYTRPYGQVLCTQNLSIQNKWQKNHNTHTWYAQHTQRHCYSAVMCYTHMQLNNSPSFDSDILFNSRHIVVSKTLPLHSPLFTRCMRQERRTCTMCHLWCATTITWLRRRYAIEAHVDGIYIRSFANWTFSVSDRRHIVYPVEEQISWFYDCMRRYTTLCGKSKERVSQYICLSLFSWSHHRRK